MLRFSIGAALCRFRDVKNWGLSWRFKIAI
jgi:hypothetical protein